MFKHLNNFSKMDKNTRIKFWTWLGVSVLSIICLIVICIFLAISYHDTYNYVYVHFNPETGIDHTLEYKNGKDFLLTSKEIPTYGELFAGMGHDSFTWFYITKLKPLSLIPYILLPFVVIISLVSSITFFFIYRKIWPPIKKEKKVKEDKKQKKGEK